MNDATKRRVVLLTAGVLVAAVATGVSQLVFFRVAGVAGEPYAVATGLGVAMPLLLAGSYPRTEDEASNGWRRATLVGAEACGGVLAGVGAVSIVVTADPPTMLPVGIGAATAFLGGIAARSLVFGLFATEDPA